MNSYHFITFIVIIASRKLRPDLLAAFGRSNQLANEQYSEDRKKPLISKLTKKKDDIYIQVYYLAQLACRVEVKGSADKIFIAI